jgi:hypothetical protein
MADQSQIVGNFGWNPGNGSSPRRRVHVLRGFEATNAMKLTRSATPATGFQSGAPVNDANGLGEIYSGMIISLNDNGQWVRGQSKAGKTCYVALSNASDTDVRASGLLPALSCADVYEIETPWFVLPGTYVADETYLYTPLVATANAGWIAEDPSPESDTVIGKVTKAPYKLNQVDLLTGNDGQATHPFQSNELGTSEVLAFKTTQD